MFDLPRNLDQSWNADEGQTGKSGLKASEAKQESADTDVKMEPEESDDVMPDIPEDDVAAEEEDAPLGQKESGMLEGFDANIPEEAEPEASSSTKFVFADGPSAENVAVDVPNWILSWDYGISEMAVEPARSLDPYPRAPEILDHVIGTWIVDAYNVFIGKFVIRTQIASAIQVMRGKWPGCGEDENGELRPHSRGDEEIP